MIYTIQNQHLTVQISDLGAELQSIRDAEGVEWLWQGDPEIWKGRAPNLFPFCGRLWNGLGTVDGAPCSFGTHGFFRQRVAKARQISDTEIEFTQTEGEDTLKGYPFAFEVKLRYSLQESRLTVRAEITNTGDRTMPYGYGGHPGFSTAFAGGKTEDYYLEFPCESEAKALRFCPDNCFLIGGTKEFPLRDGKIFDLTDDFFATGSSFLCDMPDRITLKSRLSDRSLTLRYPDFPYLGFWKNVGGAYICVEPWCSLPAYLGQNTELYDKKDLRRAEPGQTNVHEYSIEIN